MYKLLGINVINLFYEQENADAYYIHFCDGSLIADSFSVMYQSVAHKCQEHTRYKKVKGCEVEMFECDRYKLVLIIE